MGRHTVTGKRAERGFTYLSLLFFVAVLGIGLAATAGSWRHAQQRENERELLFVGEEFRQAIALYYHRSPGAIKEFPRDLGDLLRDPRYPGAQRYLRRIYRDPMRNEPAWGTVRSPDGGIMGVFSLSEEAPIRKTGFVAEQAGFERASAYADWQFVYVPVPSPSTTAVAGSTDRLSGAAVKQ
jgi:type II secretory pathway pseudopilin PulG